jgi:phosphatidate cytidylyltransferase
MTRLLSGVVLAAVALAAILFLPINALRVVACLVAIVAADEYLRLVSKMDGPTRAGMAVSVAIVCWWVSRTPLQAMMLLLAGLAVVAFQVLFRGRTVQQAAAEALGPVYIGIPLGMLVALHAIHGWQATLLLIGTVVVSDSAQYYSGRAFGRRPLAPAISPKKTIEGAVGGVIVGSLFMLAAGTYVFRLATPAWLLLLGVAIAILGICGDLFESRLKRIAGLKDSSSLIPGHGGVLDRIDALLFAIPVFYLAVQRLA